MTIVCELRVYNLHIRQPLSWLSVVFMCSLRFVYRTHSLRHVDQAFFLPKASYTAGGNIIDLARSRSTAISLSLAG